MREFKSLNHSSLFRTFFRRSPTPLAILDVCNTLVDANEAFARVLGKPVDTLRGQHCGDLLSRTINPALEAAIRSKKPVHLSRCVFPSLERELYWDCTIAPVGGLVMLSMTDVTGQVFAEQELLERKEYLDRLLNMMSDAVFTVRYPERTIEYANLAMTEMFGYAQHEVVGFSTRVLYPDEKSFEDFGRLCAQTVRSGGGHLQTDIRLKRKSGETFWANVHATFPLATDKPQHAISVVRDISERKKAEEQLGRSRQQLHMLYRRLQQTREEEQVKIAREMHDTLGQTLTGLKIDVSLLEQDILQMQPQGMHEALRQRIEGINKLIDTTIETARSIAAELRIGVLESMGFGAAVRWQALEFENKLGIPTVCDVPEGSWDSFDRDRARALFRILQEALTNVARHAKANHVWISVRRHDQAVELEVLDDGIGFDPHHLSDPLTLGLVGMSERARTFGGSFQISARREGGTCVRASIPTITTSSF